jgi:hypothetical protein
MGPANYNSVLSLSEKVDSVQARVRYWFFSLAIMEIMRFYVQTRNRVSRDERAVISSQKRGFST